MKHKGKMEIILWISLGDVVFFINMADTPDGTLKFNLTKRGDQTEKEHNRAILNTVIPSNTNNQDDWYSR